MSATAAQILAAGPRRLEHASLGEWRMAMGRAGLGPDAIKKQSFYYERFRDRWPDLAAWAAAPLDTRLGRVRGQDTGADHADTACYYARAYLKYLALTGRAAYGWDFALAADTVGMVSYGDALGLPFNRAWVVGQQCEGITYRWAAGTISAALIWAYSRFILHSGDPDVDRYGLADLLELRDQVIALNSQLAALATRGSGNPASRLNAALGRLTAVHGFWYCQGTTDVPYVRPFRREELPDLWSAPPRMAAVLDRYCAQRLSITPLKGVGQCRRELRLFTSWLCEQHPAIQAFAEVTRRDVEAYLEHLRTAPRPKLGRPLGITTRRQVISFLRQFFADTAEWGYDDVPARQLISRADTPRALAHVPRFIPDHELALVMLAIRELPDLHQRAALLILRWSGARRDEVRRLELDCLDAYPDGTPRLRLPAGKTYTERMVPIAPEAADAIREIQAQRATDRDRGMTDRVTKAQVRYLFVDRGRLRSGTYLYDESLQQVCQAAGLTPASGAGNAVTAHRFRHTVGTQLANKHARVATIMAILGHANATMSMVYSAISDEELVSDYASALKPGAVLAGPAATLIRNKELPAHQLDWLQSNYFKSELELGACLKLPDEGPCECELFMTCAKFFTTAEHAPRIRQRWHREQQLIADAADHGWPREVERHQALARRCAELLAELGQPLGENPRDA